MKRIRKPIEALVAALRDELQHYGGALALLDGACTSEKTRNRDSRKPFPHPLDAEGTVLLQARHARLGAQRGLVSRLGLRELAPFPLWITRVEAAYQPLLSALVGENLRLLLELRRRARREHARLQKSVACLEHVIDTLSSQNPPAAHHGPEPQAAV